VYTDVVPWDLGNMKFVFFLCLPGRYMSVVERLDRGLYNIVINKTIFI
jgi:hypothetical protein